MKKSVIYYLLALLGLMLIVSGCQGTTEDAKRNEQSDKLALFLVKDLKPYEANKVKLDKLSLENTPILTDSEIIEYSWETHEFKLSKDVLLERLKGSVPTSGKAFVLVVNEERIYLGAFWTPLSSLSTPDIPIINSIWSSEDLDKSYKIDYFGNGSDLRKDDRIYEVLKKTAKLK